MILALVAVIFQLLYVITFAYTFGVKTNDVQVMLNSGNFQSGNSKESKMVVFLNVCCCMSYICVCMDNFSYSYNFQTRFKSILSTLLLLFMTIFPVYSQITASPSTNLVFSKDCVDYLLGMENYATSNCTTAKIFYSMSKIGTLICGELVYNALETLVFVLAISGYVAAKEAAHESKHSRKLISKTSTDDIEYHLKKMHSLQQYFDGLNRVGNKFFLLSLCLLIPWTSFRLTDSLPSKGNKYVASEVVLVKVYNWLVFIFYSAIMYFAAETKRRVRKCK